MTRAERILLAEYVRECTIDLRCSAPEAAGIVRRTREALAKAIETISAIDEPGLAPPARPREVVHMRGPLWPTYAAGCGAHLQAKTPRKTTADPGKSTCTRSGCSRLKRLAVEATLDNVRKSA